MNVTIQKLSNRHFKILEFCLRGWTGKQIANHLKMSETQISIITKSPTFQYELAMRREKLDNIVDDKIVEEVDEVENIIKEGTVAAARRLVGTVQNADSNVALKASEAVLDRGGYPKVSSTEKRVVNVNIDAKLGELIKETLELDKD